MIALWLAVAQAAPPTAVARWEVVGEHPDDGFVVDLLGEPARRIPWTGGSALRLRCPGLEVPRRVAIARGGVIALDGDAPLADGDAWVFAESPRSVSWTGWLVTPATCRVERLRTDPGPWTWAWEEWRERDGTPDTSALVGQAAAAWSDGEPLRRAALRPPGPHPVSYGHVAMPSTAEVDIDGVAWSRLGTSTPITLQGPLRARARLRDLAGREAICVQVDDEQACALAGPARETLLEDGDLKTRVRSLPDGTRVGRATYFAIAVGPGQHRITLPGDALATLVANRAEAWGRRETLPDGVAIWTSPPGTRWPAMPIDGGEPTWLVDPEPGRIAGDDLRWLPVESLPTDLVRPDADQATLWLEPSAETCTVRFGSEAFVARAPRGRFTFTWVGPEPADAAVQPVVEGCRGWLRAAQGMDPGARTMSLHTRLGPDDHVVALGDPSRPARLEIAPRRGQDRVVVRALTLAGPGEGQLRTWTIVPAELAPPHETSDGAAWSEPVRLALPAGERWRIETDGDVLIRVRQPDPTAPLPPVTPAGRGPTAAPMPPPDLGDLPRPAAPVASEAAVRAASAAVADAPDSLSRVAALLTRARLLAALDLLELAGRDLALAEELDPDAEGVRDDVLDRLRIQRERTLYGSNRWRAEGPLFVTGDDDGAARRARAAHDGDPLAVAVETSGPESQRWWLRAVYGGQILDADQRLAAYRATATGPVPDHPALAGLRGLSTWRTQVMVDGGVSSGEVTWGTPPADGSELLFPEAWPRESIVSLSSGWALRLAPRSTTWRVPVRCRPLIADVERRCRFEATSVSGRVLAQVDVGSWGRAGTLVVPPGGVAYIRLTGRGVSGSVRWPLGRPPVATRNAFRVPGGRRVGTAVLGPTVLLAEVRPRGAGASSVEVMVGDAPPVTLPVPPDGRVLIPVDAVGPARVWLRFDGGVYLWLAQRRPRRGGPTPAFDRSWAARPDPLPVLAALADEGGDVQRADAPVPTLPRALPADSPPITGVVDLWLGSANPAGPEPARDTGGPLVAGLTAGIRSRAAVALWVEADAGGQIGSGDHRIGWLHAGLDRRLGDRRTRVSLLGDLDVATGPFAGMNLTMASARVGVRALHPLRGAWVFEGVGTIDGALRSELDTASAFPVDRPRLWSRYREDHRTGLDLDAALRVRVGPWSSSRLALGLATNEPGNGQPLDHLTLDARTDFGRPRIWTRLRASLDLRLADADRSRTYLSPLLEGRAVLSVWPGVAVGLRPWAQARWRPIQGSASLLIGVESRFGPPRALADERPSRLAERHLGEAGFWHRAAERWPAGGPTDSPAEDAAPSPEAETDRPGDALPDEGAG